MEIQGSTFILRPYRQGDQDALVEHANNLKIWENLGNLFPHPYTRKDADWWLDQCAALDNSDLRLAIEIDSAVVGGISLEQLPLYSEHSWSTGYWLGEAYWGRGIVSEAVGLLTAHAFDELNARRVQAWVFEWNPASRRVLEKNGFQFEGRLRQMVEKGDGDGRRIGDCLILGRIREDRDLQTL